MSHLNSHKIYPPSLKIPKYIQFLFRFINFISTKIAIVLAAKLFSTPVKFKMPNREIPMFESSQKSYLEIPSIAKKIHVLSYGYSDKKILLAHGWAGRSTQLFMIANKLLENGFMVISFDGPAHGKSTGKTSNLLEYIEAIKELNKEYGPFYAAIGHSFGGMGILNAQAENGFFERLITIGSGDKVSDILTNFGINLGLKKSFGNRLKNHVEKKWRLKVDDYASNHAAKKIESPVMVLHDSLDGDVHVSSALNIRQSLKRGSLLITNGLGHTKILRSKEIINTIVEFLKQNNDEEIN